MAAVLLFVLLCIGLYFLHIYLKKDVEKIEHYRELASYFSESEIGLIRTNRHDTRNSDDVIRKFFKEHPEKLAKAEIIYREKLKRKHINSEYLRKEKITRRVFAYTYEDMLYQIFAPFAKEQFGEWHSCGTICESEMIKRISEIKNVTTDEAKKILKLLEENYLVFNIGDLQKEYRLTQMLEKSSGGGDNGWDIVSDIDMNFDKWMVAHGYEHKKIKEYANNCK